MNNKGQSLVLCVIIMPIILLAFLVVIEKMNIAYNNRKLLTITKEAIANCIDSCEKNDIIDLYDRNNIDLDSIDIKKSDVIEIIVKAKVKNNIKSLVKKEDYKIKLDLIGKIEDEKLKYEKGN